MEQCECLTKEYEQLLSFDLGTFGEFCSRLLIFSHLIQKTRMRDDMENNEFSGSKFRGL